MSQEVLSTTPKSTPAKLIGGAFKLRVETLSVEESPGPQVAEVVAPEHDWMWDAETCSITLSQLGLPSPAQRVGIHHGGSYDLREPGLFHSPDAQGSGYGRQSSLDRQLDAATLFCLALLCVPCPIEFPLGGGIYRAGHQDRYGFGDPLAQGQVSL